ncbi:penicillin-binding protein 2 [Radiobacillus kanasensis]|uniref:peptidoglycan D,D-transpeptidase FtsI family protein n=1 Tax=Radiobacillus kanasensis TaxID=2844358 RepID=UPI001E538AEF|nr:penicillin-binding protein 2 [Radiobacillus kanasensis]UFT97790.1 penicillin-binding protein 2 [Radiobacillus kanasensis]
MVNEKKKKRSPLPFRLNILFVFVFLLFSLLILQLGVVQILNGEEAQEKINRTVKDTSKSQVPRGKMYDRFGRLVLDNEPVRSITYTAPKNGASAEKKLDLAEKLSQYIDLEYPYDELRERDKKEYWYLQGENAETVADRLTKKEKEMEPSDQYQALLDHITEEDLATIDWNKQVIEVIAIKRELDEATELTPHIVKNEGVTQEEYAVVAEHLNQLSGIDASIDWERKPIFGQTFANYIGSITDSDEGIPSENEDYYLSNGYSRNDRVGTSGLEQEYESVLRGTKEQVLYTTNKDGEVVNSEVVVEGQRGNDLVLTIDMELQKRVDEIVKKELKAIRSDSGQNRYVEDALVAMLDPQTGEVLALSGQHYDSEENEIVDESFRVVYDQHRPGSTVKGASVLAGLDAGLIDMGTTFNDRSIKIAGTPEKRSYKTLGPVNDLKALERSSNVYMFFIAMRMLGDYNYQRNDSLNVTNTHAFQDFRNYFSQFGLGVETGIDLPYEANGYKGQNPQAGNLLDFAIGQYDTFTTLQLAQYVSTIANDGYRIRPRLVSEIRQPSLDDQLGPVVKNFNTDVLNKIEMDDQYIERVQQGFINVFHGSQGTANNTIWAGAPYKPAGKTGTAENAIYEDGKLITETENLTLVGYAPYDDPEVAFAVVVPHTGTYNSKYSVNHTIGRGIMDAYFNLKKERQQNGVDMNLKDKEKNQGSNEKNKEE